MTALFAVPRVTSGGNRLVMSAVSPGKALRTAEGPDCSPEGVAAVRVA